MIVVVAALKGGVGKTTTSVYLTAIAACRPLPVHARPAPKARNIVVAALKGWRGSPDTAAGSR